MPSFKSTALAVSAVFFGLARAQEEYNIDPDSVDSATRDYWCESQKSSCPLICNQISNGQPRSNDCDAGTLVFSCVCGNGVQPNVSEYSQTIPYFKCSEWGNQCVADCQNNDASCQSDCRQNHPCGAQNPSPPNASITTTTSKGTPSPTGDEASQYSPFNPDGDSAAVHTLEASKGIFTLAVFGSIGLGVFLL